MSGNRDTIVTNTVTTIVLTTFLLRLSVALLTIAKTETIKLVTDKHKINIFSIEYLPHSRRLKASRAMLVPKKTHVKIDTIGFESGSFKKLRESANIKPYTMEPKHSAIEVTDLQPELMRKFRKASKRSTIVAKNSSA